MPLIEYETYRRWLDKWKPHLVYGAHATSGGVSADPPTRGHNERVSLSQLPSGDIVRAY